MNSSPQASAIAAEITTASKAGYRIDLGAYDHRQVAIALHHLVTISDLAAAEYGARAFHRVRPDEVNTKRLCDLFDQLPPEVSNAPFIDDRTKDVQLVRVEGSDTVIFLFCDVAGGLGMPIPLAHRWFAPLGANLVYLRDFRNAFYLGGIGSLGSREASVVGLSQLATSLQARRIACYGNSSGVFAALLYALHIGAGRVLGLAGPTNVSLRFNAHLRLGNHVRSLAAAGFATDTDLRSAYASAGSPPQTLLIYGAQNWDDRIHAEYMVGLPSVTLQEIPNARDHNMARTLVRSGRFQKTLQWLVEGS
jgi:hypothetical protein